MNYSTFLIALALGTDAFSVGVAVGPRVRAFRQHFRLVWHFAWFQFMMTFLGALLGDRISSFVAGAGKFLACALLGAVAVHMFISALKGADHSSKRDDPTKGWSLVGLSVATSLDALAVGAGYGLIEAKVFLPSVVIGIVAGLMTLAGLPLGRRLHGRLGNKAEFLGAAILAALALRQLL